MSPPRSRSSFERQSTPRFSVRACQPLHLARACCPVLQASLPSGRSAHPEKEGLQVFRSSPPLQDAIQGLDVPGATYLVPPGDKACRKRRKAELFLQAEGHRPWWSEHAMARYRLARWPVARAAPSPWLPTTLHPQRHLTGCGSVFSAWKLRF